MHCLLFIWPVCVCVCVGGGGGGGMYSLQFQYIISSTATLTINTKLPIALSDFYKEYIVTWTSLCEDNSSHVLK